jgi:uncharacterized RDD family membrane protein YckC
MAERLGTARLAAQASARRPADDADHAGLGPRSLAYLLDSLILFAFTMLFALAAFLNIFLRSDSGRENPSDAEIWASVLILMLTVPCWFLLNVVLSAKRGQSLGQYVIGLQVVREEGRDAGFLRLLAYLLALHPLLFHPLLAGFWLLFAYVSISLSESTIVFLAALAMALLCLLGPLANLLVALSDPQRRGLHDRIAGTKVVRVG